MAYSYPITIEHLFISPGHNYFGRPKDGPGPHATIDAERAEVRAGLGLVGDRYFAVPAQYNAQITFVAAEVFDEVRAAYGAHLSPILMRRNVVVRGAPLLQLIGQSFAIETAGEHIGFEGASHCAPCAWMDAMIAPGAQAILRGRGGLRARVIDDGALQRGPALLLTDFPLEVERALETVQHPRLPD